MLAKGGRLMFARLLCILLALGMLPAFGQLSVIRRFTLEEFAGRDWAPELLRYAVELPAGTDPKKLALIGPDGAPVAFQLDDVVTGRGRPTRARLAFVAGLPANAAATYTLAAGAPPRPPAGVTRAKRGAVLELSNAICAVRVPAASTTYKTPVPASEVPGPILGMRLADGAWVGASALHTARLVSGYAVRTVMDGPACAEVEITYAFAPKGFYRVNLRVAAGLDYVAIREAFDLGTIGVGPRAADCETPDYLVINLAEGWKPDTLRGEGPMQTPAAVKEQAAERGGDAYWGKAPAWYVPQEVRITPFEVPLDFTRDNLAVRLRLMTPWGADFGNVAGVFRDADWQRPDAPFIGVAPAHAGYWRRGMSLELRATPAGAVLLKLPISARLLRWDYECGEESSPFSSGEFDPKYPLSYGRRAWALVLGPLKPARELFACRLAYGFLSLDRIKDWVLDWPMDDGTVYPRVFTTPAELAARRRALETHPARKTIAPYLDERAEAAAARAEGAVAGLRACVELAARGSFHSHYRQLQAAKNALGMADLALASPHLTPAQRRELRTWLAIYSYMMADPDFNPRGAGNHLGNPTMPFNRIGGLAFSAALIPDHPKASYWLAQMDGVLDYFLGRYHAPEGCFIEDPGYFIVTGATLHTQMALALQRAGVRDFGHDPRLQADARYALNLLTPVDPRFGQRRLIGFGTHDAHPTPIWMQYAALFQGRNDALAGQMMWAWQAMGAMTTGADFVDNADFLYLDPTIAPRDPRLKSESFPGFGVMLRDRVGTPDESLLALRAGYQMSHWEPDQGHFAFFAKGEPLVMPWLAHYKNSAGVPAGLNHLNTLRFGAPDKEQMFGMCDARVSRQAFLPRVNYARAVVRYPDSYSRPSPGVPSVAAPQPGLPGTPGEFTWTRQLQLLTDDQFDGPAYLVIRDSVAGDGKLPSWWHLWAQGAPEDVTARGRVITYRQPRDVLLDVHVLAPADGKIETIPHTNALNAKDRMVLTRLAAPAGGGYLTVLYPYKVDEQPAAVDMLSEGVVKVTHPLGADYLFLSPTPIIFAQDGVQFAGCGGAVRVTEKAVTLALTDGPGRVGYHGAVLEGQGPFAQTIALDGLKAGVMRMPAAVTFPLPQIRGDEVEPGVIRQVAGNAPRYVFTFPAPRTYTDAQVTFTGQAGAIEVDGDTCRFLLAAGAGRLQAGERYIEGEGPFLLTMTRDGLSGTVDGLTRVIIASVPPGIVGIPDLFIDGTRWSPGTWDRAGSGWYAGLDVPRQMAIAVPAGKRAVEVKAFVYPPAWAEK